MMYTIYRLSDGVVIGHKSCPAKLIERNTPAGCGVLEGAIDATRFKVDVETKELVALPEPSQAAALDEETRQLARERIASIEAGQVRTIREALLGDAAAVERLREQEPEIAAAREVLRRPRPPSPASDQVPPAVPEPPEG